VSGGRGASSDSGASDEGLGAASGSPWWPGHEHRDCGGHGTGGHAPPTVRGAREGRVEVGVWRGRRCCACFREGRRDGAVRKLELELEPAMAARRPRSVHAPRARGSEQGVERGMERVCWCPSSSAAGRRARQWRRTTRQESSAMVATSMDTRRRPGKSSSTWRASVWARWGADLGHFQAESDLGPKIKFVHLSMLYIFD
jgi:hypothetical protein